MFTGLIEDVGTLATCKRTGDSAKLSIRTKLPIVQFAIGDSVAVNGACLTVESMEDAGILHFHTLAETLDKTNLGQLPMNSQVNLERAMRLDARLGGHLVAGHVDAVSQVRAITNEHSDYVITVDLPETMAPFVIPKGSIAINGISLTIANLAIDYFTLHIIPHTWAATNLKTLRTGDFVNLEADMIGKYVLRNQQLLAGTANPVDMDKLMESGFC